ncbi:protein ADP-ribosyltransferase PARP3-like [Zingiber officinale]|uniref:protein ADP-ribosyltransferase PARP3-like n=1 Tax=Zingiber officinale TaxID=94328 RepID=UPI001C4CD2D6|nr:protein ADP-ribosyltransferase PARP3-like [Zingiber officinale]
MKVRETRSHSRASSEEGRNLDKGKQKEDKDADQQQQQLQQQASKSKKPKVEGENGESASKISQEFQEFCKATRKHLSIEEMRRILEANEQDAFDSEDAVVPRCQDMMFYGALEKCPICQGQIDRTSSNYECRGAYSEWTSCTYTTMNAPRKGQPIKIPDEISDNSIKEWMKRQESAGYPLRELSSADKPLAGFVISLSGRLSRTHQAYREEIQKNGGRVSHDVNEIHCLVVSPVERERGGSVRVADAMERGIPVVTEKWLIDSIEKKQWQSLDAYDVSDLAPEGRGVPWDKMDPGEEAIESLTAEIKLHGKRCVHSDSRLREQGGTVFEKDGVVYSCAFSQYDHGRGNNEYCILQLVQVPGKNVHLYYKQGRAGEDAMADESIEEWNSVGDAVREFTRLFELFTGNECEPWEREKKFQKKKLKFYPVDMGDGVDVRHGGLGLRQLGVSVAHCELEPLVANLMKVLCSQEIYRYALMEMGYDSPHLPMGMLTDLHLKRCEEELLKFREEIEKASTSEFEARLLWDDFSSKWFTLMHSTRPFGLRSYRDLADHVAAGLERIRDVNVASRLVEDASGHATVIDPLSDRYRKLGCSITPVEREEEAYKMIVKYLETTYEPVKVGDMVYGVSVENIFSIQSSAGPSYEEIKRLPNKILLWCGTRTANLLRHLQRGLLPAVCQIPVPGYMFGRAIVCSDASAEAARYGYTAADRPEGFLLLGIVSLGERMIEISTVPEVSANKKLEEEEEKVSVKGLGKKRPEESEHFWWDADVKVPCGRLVESEHRDSPLEYNEYAVYDPKQVCMRFVVAVKYEVVAAGAEG